MLNLPPQEQDEKGLYVDIHDGSHLTLSQSTIYKDSAVRRGFIDGEKSPIDWLGEQGATVHTTHEQLRKAIIAALQSILHATGVTGDIVHPSADPEIPLDRVKVWKWGPHAYFELHYRHSRSSVLPVPAAHTVSWRKSFDHAISYRLSRGAGGFVSYLNGLPNGFINFPNPQLGASDPDNKPIGTVHKRSTQQFFIRTVLNQHPHAIEGSGSLSEQGHINSLAFPTLKGEAMPVVPEAKTTRYDGAIVDWVGIERYVVLYSFTFIRTGHYHQEAVYDYEGIPGVWSVLPIVSHQSAEWDDATFPVAL